MKLSEAVAASAAYRLVFTPIVLQAHQGKCTYREPDWLTAARYNPEATAAMRAHARALESYTNPDEVKFVKLLDGGITDNFGTTGLAVERARAQVPYAPLTAAEAVKLKRMLFLVANAGRRASDYDWTQPRAKAREASTSPCPSPPPPCPPPPARATIPCGASFASGKPNSSNGAVPFPLAEVRKLRGTTDGWDCKDVKLFVGEASFASLPTTLRDQLDAVPTRLKLPRPRSTWSSPLVARPPA